MKQNTKMMIKAKTANAIHSIIDPNPVKPKYTYQRRCDVRFRELREMTVDQKLEMFDKIIDADYKGSFELTSCMHKKREKKRVQKLRDAKIAAGERKPKVKQTKEEKAKYMTNKAA